MGSFLDAICEAATLAEQQVVPEGLIQRGYAFSNEERPEDGMVPVGETSDGWWYQSMFGSWHRQDQPVTQVFQLGDLRWCFTHNAHPVGQYPEACASYWINQGASLLSERAGRIEAKARADVYRKVFGRLLQLDEDGPHLGAGVRGMIEGDVPKWRKDAFYHPGFVPRGLVEEILEAATSWQRKEAGSISRLKAALRRLKEAVEANGIPVGPHAGRWRPGGGSADDRSLTGHCPSCGSPSVSLRVRRSGEVQTYAGQASDPRWKPTPLLPEGQNPKGGTTWDGWDRWQPSEVPPICRFCAVK